MPFHFAKASYATGLYSLVTFKVLITQSHSSAAQTSSSFKWPDMRMSMSTTPTFITKALCLVTYLNDCYSELIAYTALAYSYWASFLPCVWMLRPRPLMLTIQTTAAI